MVRVAGKADQEAGGRAEIESPVLTGAQVGGKAKAEEAVGGANDDMPFIRVRALKRFKIGEHWLKKGELFYLPPAVARALQTKGKVEMLLTRYPERLEEAREAIEEEIDALDSDPEL